MTVKRLLCVLLVVLLLVVPVSADYDSYYEVEPVVSSPMAFSAPATMAVVDSGISTMNLTSGESQMLSDIRNALVAGYTNATSTSILGLLRTITSNSNAQTFDIDAILTFLKSNADASILGYLSDIEYYDSLIYSEIQNLDNVTLPYANDKLDQIVSALTNTTDGLKPVVSILATRLNSILSDTDSIDSNVNTGLLNKDGYSYIKVVYDWLFWHERNGFIQSLVMPGDTAYGYKTLYSLVLQLQQVLASDDDLALANSQKENREEIEDTFLSGSSGGTSLGKSDFGALSDIGDTVKETISLNGQSSVSDFTDGLADADEAGQGWFSESTRSALDTVSSSASYGLRDDPYNMSGWQDRYAWLEGEE